MFNRHNNLVFTLLAFAGFLSLASTRLCDAMLPALAQTFETSPSAAAAAISSYAVAYSVMQIVYGPLGDRFGKLHVIALASAYCALSTALAAMAPSLSALVLARAAMGAGAAAIIPLGLAWIGDTVPLAQRQQALARYSGVTVVGHMAGPLLGGVFTQMLNWRAAFLVIAPMFACMALLLWLRMKAEPVPSDSVQPAGRCAPYFDQARALLADPWARWVLTVGCLEGALGIGCMAFVPTVLHTDFGLTLMEGGSLVALFGLGGFLFSQSAAALLRRVPAATLPGIAGVLLALGFGLLAVMPHWGWAIPACLLAGFGFFMLHNTLQVQATQLSATASGLVFSLFTCAIFMGQSVGVALGAVSFTRFAPAWSFGGAGLALMLTGLALMRLLRARANA